MKIFYVVMLLIFSSPLSAESIQEEYAQKVASSFGIAVVDAKIESSCVKQVSPTTGQTNIANRQECHEALNKLESSLGKTEDEPAIKRNINRFRQQYGLL